MLLVSLLIELPFTGRTLQLRTVIYLILFDLPLLHGCLLVYRKSSLAVACNSFLVITYRISSASEMAYLLL